MFDNENFLKFDNLQMYFSYEKIYKPLREFIHFWRFERFEIDLWRNTRLFTLIICLIAITAKIMISVSAGKTCCLMLHWGAFFKENIFFSKIYAVSVWSSFRTLWDLVAMRCKFFKSEWPHQWRSGNPQNWKTGGTKFKSLSSLSA